MSSHFTVIYDACVLYPAPLRSLLMYLALTDMFRARWTSEIHDEWMRNVRQDYPDITQAQVENIRDLMNSHVRNCLVTGYEFLIPTLTLPDPSDRHVLAAAIRVGADVIVTANLADFPASQLSKYGIEAQHPDEFVMHLLDLAPQTVCTAAKHQRASLKKPPLNVEEYLASLQRQGLAQTVSALRQFAQLI
ncbi:MAG TPA: PIN domain-containing protein [Pirellulales bacterium]|nr:PIN domain-containing protein [Pirellulales bacterium]